MRHAKSSWFDASLDDHERPLNKRGRRDAPRMAQELRDLAGFRSHSVETLPRELWKRSN